MSQTSPPLMPPADAGEQLGSMPPHTALPRGLVGRGMPRRFGPLLHPLARRFLDEIPFPLDMTRRIRELHAQGAVVVWVHRARNPIEHLALARVVAREGLPRAEYVGGLDGVAFQPLRRTWARLREGRWRRDEPDHEEELLRRCVEAGLPAEIFLRRPMTLLSATSAFRARLMEVLVGAQRTLARPIVLVPVFLALKQRPGHFEPTTIDAIFGTVEEPGLLRALGRLLLAGSAARFEVSEPVDLEAFVRTHTAHTDAVIAKKVRWSILHHLARVERVAHGPPLKSLERMRDEVLRDHSLRDTLDDLARSSNAPRQELDAQARAIHDEIAARFDVDVTRILSRLLDVVWNRIYDGVHFDVEDMERLRTAARRGPLVLVPSHRSHVDYLVMSQVMLKAGLVPPFIAAGDNLAFFPLGSIFRRCGAFFLRRSFKGDVVYGAVFRAYVRKLFTEGFTQEFFIEGGRSRTGKTLPPKLGLLSMLVDAYLESREEDAIFVPCHIAYERVIEANTYVGELGGKKKERESAVQLVKSAQVLRRRYGRVYVTFDEPISLAAHLRARGLKREDHTADERRLAVQTLGHRIVYGINRAGVITSTSLVVTALFGLRRKGVDEQDLLRAAHALRAHLDKKPPGSVRWQPGLRGPQTTPADDMAALRAALERLVDDGLIHRVSAGTRTLCQMAPDAVLPLDTFKNQLLHHVVPEAIVATALRAAGGTGGRPVSRASVKSAALLLSRVLKLEFIFRVGATFDELFDEAVRTAVDSGLLSDGPDGLCVTTPEARVARRFAASLIANFVEAYHACFRAVPVLLPREDKVLVATLLDTLKAHVLAGEVACAEAASKAIVENAVAVLRELGIIDAQGVRAEQRDTLDAMTQILDAARPPRG